VLVSIFGGLTRVDKVAKNLCELLGEGACTKPVVFRLMGTDTERASAVLEHRGHLNHGSLEDAVTAVVDAARGREAAPLTSGVA
jgi:succinyl-CoA synthetase beta subunit